MKVWHATSCTSTRSHPILDTVHAKLFAGIPVPNHDYATIWNSATIPPLRITKNLFRLGNVFPTDLRLCVSEPLRRRLEAVCTARFRPVIFESTYYYEFAPGNMGFRDDTAYDDSQSSDGIALAFANKYKTPSRGASYFEVVAVRVADVRQEYSDWTTRELRCHDSGVVPQDVLVSAEMLRQHGMCRGAGYQMTDALFQVLRSELEWPFFWTTCFDIPD